MLKITGLDELTRQLEDAQKAFQELDGELGTVNFDPHDPQSIDLAIRTMEGIIDARVGRYANNSIVAPLIDDLKESYRAAILEKAATARIEGDS